MRIYASISVDSQIGIKGPVGFCLEKLVRLALKGHALVPGRWQWVILSIFVIVAQVVGSFTCRFVVSKVVQSQLFRYGD